MAKVFAHGRSNHRNDNRIGRSISPVATFRIASNMLILGLQRRTG